MFGTEQTVYIYIRKNSQVFFFFKSLTNRTHTFFPSTDQIKTQEECRLRLKLCVLLLPIHPHLDSLVMTRIKAPFSSFSLWFSILSSSFA